MGLDIVEMVIALETEFCVSLPDAELRNAETVEALFELIGTHLGQTSPTQRVRFHESSWQRYLDVIERETGARRHDLVPKARFIRDLGLG